MGLTIGKLAKQADVTIETIRYYQRKGLLHEPEKPNQGFRQYPSSAINRIRFVKRAQLCGFTRKEILELLALESGHCQDVRKIAEQKCSQVNEQINDLIALRAILDDLVKGCNEESTTEQCSLIQTLSNQAATKL